jgi:hypothetical protein
MVEGEIQPLEKVEPKQLLEKNKPKDCCFGSTFF